MNMSTRSRRTFLKSAFAATTGLSLAPSLSANTSSPKIELGIDMLAQDQFRMLRAKRVGLLTHPAGVNRFGISTIDVLRTSPIVDLVALFGPEHGIYGDEKANVPVLDKIDPRTGLPVFSLYGQYRRPTTEMLSRIDTMVVDLQDIGVRSYTYVSCMRYVMEECFKHEKEVIILDRPNPLGGVKVDGPNLERNWMSYVGAFQVPYVHGMTIGELARMAKSRPGILDLPDPVRRKGVLKIVRMSGWKRNMLWNSTGLKWIPTSPAIPDLSAALGYPMTGLGAQLGSFTHGYGTRHPFRLLLFPQRSPDAVSRTFASRGIRGLQFPVIGLTINGKPQTAAYVQISDWNALSPTELSLHMMAIACAWDSANPFAAASDSAKGLFNKHVGDARVLDHLLQFGSSINIKGFLQSWQNYCSAFKQMSAKYHLYQN